MLRRLTLDEIVEVTGGALVDGPLTIGISGEEEVLSVSTDTRTLQPAALFVALRGETHDGHDHLDAAQKAGTNAFVVDRPLHGALLPHVVVDDTTYALGDIARYVRDAFTGPVVGITGSVGKTTTKEMVSTILETQFTVRKSAANFNNEIGVPQTIFGMEPGHSALVLEMGMRGLGQIRRLAEIGAPTVGIITGIGVSHVELLGSRYKIAEAKGELFELLPADGAAIYPAADAFAAGLRARFKGTTTYSCAVDSDADVKASDLLRQDNGWRFRAETPWGSAELFVPSPGRFNVLNALYAVAAGGHLGVPLDAIASALQRWTPPAMRLETLEAANGATVLSDAYNAAPDSMIAALETLHDTPVEAGGKRIAVLGEMRELGDFAAEGHALVGRAVAKFAPDMLVTVGPLTGKLVAAARVDGFPADRIHTFETTEEAAKIVPFILQPGDAVLVKGSRLLALEQVVAALTGDEAAEAHP